MTALDVRDADARDCAGISAVGTASFHAAYDGTGPPDEIVRHVAAHFGPAVVSRELADPRVTYLVAARDGVCLGFAKLRDSMVPAAVPGKRPLEIQQLYVDPRNQRGGLGRRLVDAAAARARQRGCDGLWLTAWTRANWALAFYRRTGFAVIGTVTFRLDATEYLDYLMWLPLAAER